MLLRDLRKHLKDMITLPFFPFSFFPYSKKKKKKSNYCSFANAKKRNIKKKKKGTLEKACRQKLTSYEPGCVTGLVTA